MYQFLLSMEVNFLARPYYRAIISTFYEYVLCFTSPFYEVIYEFVLRVRFLQIRLMCPFYEFVLWLVGGLPD